MSDAPPARGIVWRVEIKGTEASECVMCEHVAREHGPHGCEADWEWDQQGVATTVGCSCETQVHR